MVRRDVYRGKIVRLFDRQRGLCTYCERPMFLIGAGKHPLFATIDHRHPESKGGKRTDTNTHAACAQCNALKDTLSEEEFRALLRDLGDIHAVVEALQGPFMARRWRTESAKPIPEQPRRPQSFYIPPTPPKPKPKGSAHPQRMVVKPDLAASFVIHVYDLKLNRAFEETYQTFIGARGRARALVHPTPERFVCKITPRIGDAIFLYHSTDHGWRWTDYAPSLPSVTA